MDTPCVPAAPEEAVGFLNAAFDALSRAEAADKAHRLDDAANHYETFIRRVGAYLASPVCALLTGEVDAADLRAMLPGVKLRLKRLLKMRSIRDTPPVPGAIPLTGPAAGASIAPEDMDQVTKRAEAIAAQQGYSTAAGSPSLHPQRGPSPAGAARAGSSGASANASASSAEGAAFDLGASAAAPHTAAAEDRSGATDGAGARSATGGGCLKPPRCENCGIAGRWGDGSGAPGIARAADGGGGRDTDDGRASGGASPTEAPVASGDGPGSGAAASAAGPPAGGAAPRGPSLLRCGRCRRTFYCCAACQRAHWPRHKAHCRG